MQLLSRKSPRSLVLLNIQKIVHSNLVHQIDLSCTCVLLLRLGWDPRGQVSVFSGTLQ